MVKTILTILVASQITLIGGQVQPVIFSNPEFPNGTTISANLYAPVIDFLPGNIAFVNSGPQSVVRWTGKITPEFAETYTFSTITRDGVKLWVDGKLVIDAPDAVGPYIGGIPGPLNQQATINLEANRSVLFTMEIYGVESSATAKEAHLYWSSASQPNELVPVCGIPRVYPLTGELGSVSLGTDPADVPNPDQNDIDLLDFFVDDGRAEFLGFNLVHRGKRSEPTGATNIFIDTNSNTGFPVYSIKADYLIQGRQLLRYANGSWSEVATINHVSRFSEGRFVQKIAIDRKWIGNPSTFRMIFYGNNPGTGGTSVDVYPDNAGGGGFKTWTQRAFPTLNGNLSDWARYTNVFPRDPADQPVGSAVDIRQLLFGNNSASVHVGIWNAGNINLNNNHMIFIEHANSSFNQGYPLYGKRAEFLIRGRSVYRYTGGGSGTWSWDLIGTAELAVSGTTAELRFPTDWLRLNNRLGTFMSLKYFGQNPNGSNDVAPQGSDWYTYQVQY